MMCAGNEERIARYLGGDLAPEEAVLIERHLQDCGACGELARGMEQDREWLASRPPELAEVDFAAMRREIRREIARPRWGWKWVAAAAGMALLALGVALYRPPVPRKSEPSMAQTNPPPAPPANVVATVTPKRPRRVKRIEPLPRGTESPVQIRIATRDPNVTIILLHESKGALQ